MEMVDDYYDNGRYRGRKDPEGRIFDDKGNLIGIDNRDGSYIDFRTGDLWRKERR